ncbi:MAG: hypothetical protein SFX74_09940 [Fimbriimonadaceae bacterium]|nr:hypothetical protein [Fimbriimonadaceae bacterium]
MVALASTSIIGLALKQTVSRGPNRTETARIIDEALLRGDGAAIYPYIWEEERKANGWTPEHVDALLDQVVLPESDIATLRQTTPVYEEFTFQTGISRNRAFASGNLRPHEIVVYDRDGHGRISFAGLITQALRSRLDVPSPDYPRAYPGYTARRMREKEAFLNSLRFRFYAIADTEAAVVKVYPYRRRIQVFEARARRQAESSRPEATAVAGPTPR